MSTVALKILPYKFNGKELDQETGLYYYGARYMNPVTSLWYGVDPLAEKYTSLSAYSYCSSNPINLIDPIGLGWVGSKGEDGTISWTWDDNVKSMNEAKQAGYFDYLEPGSIIDNVFSTTKCNTLVANLGRKPRAACGTPTSFSGGY